MNNRIKVMKKHFGKISGEVDEAATKIIEEDLLIAGNRAKQLLDLENLEVSKPFVVRTASNFNHKTKYRINLLNDAQHLDYDQSLVTTIFLGTKALYYHGVIVNHQDGKIYNDVAGEVRYNDVTHVEVVIDSSESRSKVNVITVELILNLINGTSLVFNLRTHYLYHESEYPELLLEKERYIINTIKEAIRSAR
ncbi:hypothetical protein [Haploplasma modicum]|uniref:hypothetical protein n=1 Tax=Haploplasma modicum TaxID=2150 RepID=UPI00047DAC05|nr:hypothetical protein [Haploplasma modicum]